MDKRAVKNIIIIILALLNLFLLILVVSGAVQKIQARRQRSEALTNILTNQGITVEPGAVRSSGSGKVTYLSRNADSEAESVSAVIGECTCTDKGGGIYSYSGENGTADVRSTGDFEITMTTDAFPASGDYIADAKDFLNKFGVKYDAGSLSTSQSGGLTAVTAVCSFRGRDVVNSTVTMYYTSSRLKSVSGRRPLKTVTGTKSETSLDYVSVMMTFLESIRKSGKVCSTVNSVTTEYYLDSATVSGCTLTPVWCIKTDVGNFYFDCLTGKERLQ